MAITALPTRPSRPQGTLSPQAQVEVLHMVIDDLHTMQTTAAEAGLLGEVARAQSRLDAVRLKLIAAADTGGVAQGAGLATTADWVGRQTRSTRQESAQQASLADALDGPEATLDSTRDALADGHLSLAHARVIADALTQLPAGLSAEDRARCEARLVADAARFDPTQLRRHARRVLAEVEPDPVIVDAHENHQLVTEEDAAYAAASLTFHDHGDGTITGRFTLPALQADILRKVIDAMTAPRRTTRAGQDPTTRGRLDPAHARGLAFAQLLEHLPVDHLHGRATTQVTVVMDLDTLLDTVRGHRKAAGLDTARPISAAEARRMACTSTLTPVVLGRALSGASLVLDLGRTSRLFTDAQRRAIHATHTHCAARGCTRPIAWCELHHRTAWSRGGRTDLREAVPLCGWHHRKIHDHRHHHDWHTDGTVTLRLRT